MIIIVSSSSFSIGASTEPALGSPHAPVTIIEYGSLTCDYCIRFHREVLPLLKSRHIDTGRVRFVYRDFPTGKAATRGAVAARCAGEQYYKMLDILYAKVGNWSRARNMDVSLSQLAASLGLEEKRFKPCLNEAQNTRVIISGQQQATREHGVIGTPTFIINGKIVRGIKDIDQIELLIEKALLNTRQ